MATITGACAAADGDDEPAGDAACVGEALPPGDAGASTDTMVVDRRRRIAGGDDEAAVDDAGVVANEVLSDWDDSATEATELAVLRSCMVLVGEATTRIDAGCRNDAAAGDCGSADAAD